jgi:hypothetical protein
MMANKKISQLGLATGVTGPDVVPIVSGGATKRVTLTTLSSFCGGGGGGATGPTGQAGSGATGPTGPAGAGEAYQDATAPAEASAGATWLDLDTGQYFVRYDGVWVEVGGTYNP